MNPGLAQSSRFLVLTKSSTGSWDENDGKQPLITRGIQTMKSIIDDDINQYQSISINRLILIDDQSIRMVLDWYQFSMTKLISIVIDWLQIDRMGA